MKKIIRTLAFFVSIIALLSFTACTEESLNEKPLTDYVKNKLGFSEVHTIYHSNAKSVADFVDYDMKKDSKRVTFLFGKKDGQDTVLFFLEAKNVYENCKDLGNVFYKDYAQITASVVERWGLEQNYRFYMSHNDLDEAYQICLVFNKLPYKKSNEELRFYAFPNEESLKLYNGSEFVKEI